MSMKTYERPVLSLREIVGALPVLCQWRNSKGRLMPIHLESAPGAGKTVLAESIAKSMARANPGEWVGLAISNPGIMNPAEAAGYPVFAEHVDPDGSRYRVAEYTRPSVVHVQRAYRYRSDSDDFVESVVDDAGMPLVVGALLNGMRLNRGVLVLDEFGQADVDVKKVLAPLVDEARLASYHMPLDWWVWMLSNRAQDASGVTRSLAFGTNREVRIGLAADVDALESYFKGVSLLDTDAPLEPLMQVFHDPRGRVIRDPADCDSIAHPAITAFLRQNSDIVFGGVPSDPGHSFLTPRSLEAMSNLFDLLLRLPVADESGAMDPALAYTDSFVGRYSDQHDAARRWKLFQALAGGAVGPANVSQFLATLELFNEVPSIAAIVADPMHAHVSSKADAQFLVTGMLANAMTVNNAKALLRYAQRLWPANYHNCVVAASTRDGALMMVHEVAQFYKANPESMSRMLVMQGRAAMAAGAGADKTKARAR